MTLLPTSARVLREIAIRRRGETQDAERALACAEERQEAAEEEADRAETGVAPPGFYLVDP